MKIVLILKLGAQLICGLEGDILPKNVFWIFSYGEIKLLVMQLAQEFKERYRNKTKSIVC